METQNDYNQVEVIEDDNLDFDVDVIEVDVKERLPEFDFFQGLEIGLDPNIPNLNLTTF